MGHWCSKPTKEEPRCQSTKSRVVNNDPLNPILSLDDFGLSKCKQTKSGKRIEHDSPDNNIIFTIQPLLNSSECKHIIKTSLPLMVSMEHLYNKSLRSSTRAMIHSPAIADQLYKRILPHLNRSDYVNRTPMCFGQDGVWVPFGLNDCLKIFRYETGASFTPHRDGPWIPHPDRSSMFTVIVYLNDDFQGGETEFFGSEADTMTIFGAHWMGTTLDSRFGASRCTVAPKVGSAVIFNHEQWHSGSSVVRGEKWILRTELIFMRVHSFYVDRDAFAIDEDYIAMKNLYIESQQAAVDGDRDAFFTKYQEVVHRQREAMLRDDRARKPRLLPLLDLEQISHILAFLTHSEINKLLRINRRTCMAILQAPFWQDLFEGHVRKPISTLPIEAGFQQTALRALLPIISGPSAQDYFTLVRQRLRMQTRFTPVGLFFLDSGFVLVGKFSVSEVPREGSQGYTIHEAMQHCIRGGSAPVDEGMRSTSFESLGGLNCIFTKKRYRDVYYAPHYRVPFHYSDDNVDNPLYLPGSKMPDPTPFAQLFANGFPHVRSIDCPLVVVPPMDWWTPTDGEPNDKINELATGLLHELRVPAISIMHPAVCAAIGLRRLYPNTIRENVLRLHVILETTEVYFQVNMETLEAQCVRSAEHPIVLRDETCALPEHSLRLILASGFLELTENPTFPQLLHYRC